MKKNPRSKKKSKVFLNRDFLLSCSILVICIVSAFSFALYQYNKMWQLSPKESSQLIVQSLYWHVRGFTEKFSPKPTPHNMQLHAAPTTQVSYPTSSQPKPTQSTLEYRSDKLGVSFFYLNTTGNQNFYIKEIDNHIFWYFTRDDKPFIGTDDEFLKKYATQGKFIEVFKKDPNQSFADAIKQHILNGYSESDCLMNVTRPYGYFDMGKSIQTIVLRIAPFDHEVSYAEKRKRLDNCPIKYMAFSGVSYFLMDINHPDRFLFVSIGQDIAPSGIGNTPWDQTIKIF